MSSSAGGGAGDGGEKRGGLSRFIKRAGSVLKRDRTKRQSVSGATALAPVTDDTATQTSPTPAQPPIQAATTSATPAVGEAAPPVSSKDTDKDQKPAVAPINPSTGPTAAESNKIQEEKARALFAKYNMTLEIGEWTPPFKGDAVRVEKKVRVRVHRHCHRCQTMFGTEKQCAECGHTRCKKCPKTKMTSPKERKGKSVVTGGLVVDDRYMSILGPEVLNMSYRRTGKELSGAARKMCHKCQTIFAGYSPQCGACGHQRCAQCPQVPPFSTNLMEGSLPRRRQMRALRVRVRLSCHECQKTFKDLEATCSKCGHSKCDSCVRDPGVEDHPAEDPEALRKVEERFRNMAVSPQAAAA